MENSSILVWRVGVAAFALALVALIIWAGFNANFLGSFGQVVADPWGLVAIADLYFGFVLFAGVILAVDGVKPVSFIWLLALFCLGNVLSALWLILRLPRLVAAFRT